MNTDVRRVIAEVRRVMGLTFTAQVQLDSDLDIRPDEPRDPYAYSRVPVHPRPHPRSGGVALLEPDDDY